MPWKTEWLEPELAFTVTLYIPSTKTESAKLWPYNVYHTYKNNEHDERLTYWYTLGDGLDSWGDPTNIHDFDIRNFATYHDTLSHQQIMQKAIDQELCTIEDVMIYIHPITRVSDAPQ